MRDLWLRFGHSIAFRRALAAAVFMLAVYGVCLTALQGDSARLAVVQAACRFLPAGLVTLLSWVAGRRSLRIAPRLGQAWLLIALALCSVMAGAVVDLLALFHLLPRNDVVSMVDLGQLAFYMLFMTAVLMMPRRPLNRATWLSILLDAVTISVAVVVLLWSFLFGPAIASEALTQPFSARSYALLLRLLYPAFGVMLLWTAAMTLFRRPVAMSTLPVALLFAASVCAALSNILLFAPSVAEAVWLAGCLLTGLAAIAHLDTLPAAPAAQEAPDADSARPAAQSEPDSRPGSLRRHWVRYLPLTWAVFAYLLLTWGAFYAADVIAPLPFVVSVLGVSVLFGLVLLRQLVTANQNSRLTDQLRLELAERRVAQELLFLNQQRMTYLLSATPAVIYTADVAPPDAGRFTFVSDNVRAMLGYSPAAFTADPAFLLARAHPEDCAALRHRLSRLADGEQLAQEYRVLTAAGQYVWIHDEARLIRDAAGRPVEAVGYWADVTPRRQMEQALRQANQELEARVRARTAELSQALATLTREMQERQQIEASLRESEVRFRSFVEQSTDGFLLTDEQGNIIEWNHSFEALSGMPRERAIGRKVWDAQWELVPEELRTADRRRRIEQVFRQALWAGEQPFGGRLTEGFVQTLNGQQRVVQQRAFPIRTERGILVGCVLRDITPQKEAEGRLRDSEARYRAISELISDFAFAVRVAPDNTATLEWVTDGFNRIFGGHISANGWEMLNWIEPEDRPVARAALRAALRSPRPASFQLRVRSGSGRLLWIQGNLLARREAGAGARFICAGQDITPHKQAEERERGYVHELRALSRATLALVESPIGSDIYRLIAGQLWSMTGSGSAVAVTSFDPGMRCLLLRAALQSESGPGQFATEMGFPHDGLRLALSEADFDRLLSGRLMPIGRETVVSALTGWPPPVQETLLQMTAGRPIYTMGFKWNGQLFGAVAILLPAGQTLGNPGLIETFVQQAAISLQRWEAEERLQASVREKEVMLQEIHHRVKNNLQIVSSLLSLQAARVQDANTAEMLRDTQNRVRSMAYIHERLYRSPNLARIDFAEYTRALTGHLLHSYSLTDSGAVSICVDIDDDIRLSVDAAIPCGLIVNELVSNALKHAFPAGSQRPAVITIAMRQTAAVCALTIRDNGIGLPADLDFRSPGSLGLELVSVLARQIGATIELDRQAGTAFTITFATRA